MGNVNGGKVGSLEYGMLNTCKFSLVEKGRMHCEIEQRWIEQDKSRQIGDGAL